jgi:hypothetical protein
MAVLKNGGDKRGKIINEGALRGKVGKLHP